MIKDATVSMRHMHISHKKLVFLYDEFSALWIEDEVISVGNKATEKWDFFVDYSAFLKTCSLY